MNNNSLSVIDNLFDPRVPFYNRAEQLRFTDGTPELTSFLEGTYGVKITKIWVMGWGYNNINFLADTDQGEYLVRVSQNPKTAADLDFEIMVQDYLSRKGLYVRQSLPTVEGLNYLISPQGRILQSFTYIAGDLPEKFNLAQVESSGSLLAQLHQKSEGLYSFVPSKIRESRIFRVNRHFEDTKDLLFDSFVKLSADMLIPQSILEFHSLLENITERVSIFIKKNGESLDNQDFIHNDYNPMNIVFNQNEAVGLIDFEQASFGCRLWDLGRGTAQWVMNTNYLPPEKVIIAFVKGYSEMLPLSGKQIDSLKELLLLGILMRVSACFVHYHEYHNKDYWYGQAMYFLKKLEVANHIITKEGLI